MVCSANNWPVNLEDHNPTCVWRRAVRVGPEEERELMKGKRINSYSLDLSQRELDYLLMLADNARLNDDSVNSNHEEDQEEAEFRAGVWEELREVKTAGVV